jgi:hypothetical protein
MYKTLAARKPVVGLTDYPTKMNNLVDDMGNAANLPSFPFCFKEATTAGLTLGYFGGQLSVNGVLTTIADGTIALNGSSTNYVEHTAAGVVSKNTTGFSADKFPIAEVVCDAGSITGYTDRRNANSLLIPGRVTFSVAGGVGTTVLTAAQWANDVIEFTGALTGNRTIEVPTAVSRGKIIRNNTSGAFTLTVKTNAGTGKAVTQGKRAVVFCDGTNVELATDDAAGVGAVASGVAVTASGLTMATARLIGRTTASAGAPEEISVGSDMSLTGGTLSVAAASDTLAGKIEIAVQSEMEAASSNTLAVTPGRMQYHPGVAKVWGRFGVAGNLINGYNISSIGDSGAGVGSVNFTTAFSGATAYASQFNVIDNAGATSITYVMSDAANPPTASSNAWRSMNYNWTGGQDPTVGYMYVAHGDQ